MAELELATVADLANALQDPSIDHGMAQYAINRASALVRSVARQRFTFVANDTVELVGHNGHYLVLPERPVVEDAEHPVTVMELATTGVLTPSIEGIAWYRQDDRLVKLWTSQWNPNMQFRWAGFYGPVRPVGVWGPRVQVTYSHGYLTCPPELNSVVVATAVTLFTNPQGLRSEQVGGITVTWAGESIRAPRDLVDRIRMELSAVMIRRGGAFSIQLT